MYNIRDKAKEKIAKSLGKFAKNYPSHVAAHLCRDLSFKLLGNFKTTHNFKQIEIDQEFQKTTKTTPRQYQSLIKFKNDRVYIAITEEMRKLILKQIQKSYTYEKLYRTGKSLTISDHVFGSDDISGSIKVENNAMIIAFRGSCGKRGRDWQINLNAVKETPKAYGIPLEGLYHSGFLFKYALCRASLIKTIERVLQKHTIDRWVVTGHSQGGSLSHIASLDLCLNILPQIYGPYFDNAKHNMLYNIALSPPRICDLETAFLIHQVVGKANILRVSVKHDPVPNLVPGIKQTNILKKIPLIGGELARYCGHYESLGYLALKPSSEMLKVSDIIKSGMNPLIIAAVHFNGETREGLMFKPEIVPLDWENLIRFLS